MKVIIAGETGFIDALYDAIVATNVESSVAGNWKIYITLEITTKTLI